MSKRKYFLGGSPRDKVWEEIKRKQEDIASLQSICDIINKGFSEDKLNEISEKMMLKFIEPKINIKEKEIVKLYRKLKLIK